jgi:hypothetical protein
MASCGGWFSINRCTFHDGITLIAIIYLHVLCQLRNTFYELYLRSSTSWTTCDVVMLNFIGKKKSHMIYMYLSLYRKICPQILCQRIK